MSLELAIKCALENPIKQRGRNSISRFGAVLTDGFSHHTGWNSYKTHPLVKKFNNNEEALCVHAELDALIEGSKFENNFQHYTLYVARVLKDGTPALAKPCEACQRAIIHFNVGDCKWTS